MICALVVENVVTYITPEIDEIKYQEYARQYQAVIDITETYPQPKVGWLFDGAKLSPPPGEMAAVKITKLALRNRFTFNEKLALQTALASSVALQTWFEDFRVSTYIDLTRPETIAGIQYLEVAGLIGAGRANVILTTPPTEYEIYREG